MATTDFRQLLQFSELRFAARRLRRAPSYAVAASLVLALGVGATTAVFSLVNGILLEPLPYPEAGRLVRLTHTISSAGATAVDQSDASVLLYQREARAFDGVAAWRLADGDLGPSQTGQNTIRVRAARVTANFFDVLRVRPALGRGFTHGEDRPLHNGVVVLSHRMWQDRFHGDPRAVGRQIIVNDVPRIIVGIMPPRFAYPNREVALWLPLSLDPAHTHPATFDLIGVGRLGRGASIAAARADLARVLPDIGSYFHDDVSSAVWSQSHVMPQIQSLHDSIVGPASRLLWLLFGSVLLVLLAACTNVAGLVLVRSERAELELAVRGALGAGLAGMLALSLSESVLLSVAGGGAGVALAAAAVYVARSAGGVLSLPRIEDVVVGAPVLIWALATTVFCTLYVSVLPLRRARQVAIAQVLRGGAARMGGSTRRRSRDTLVVAQISLAVVLVASSGLMTRSLLRLIDVRPGFEPDSIVVARVLLPLARYGAPASRLDFFESMAAKAHSIPGVRDVALTDWVPLSGEHHDIAIEVEDAPGTSSGAGADRAVAGVGGEYFRTMRIPLLRGRTFGVQDVARPADEVVVSRGFAERYWKSANPIGRRVRPVGGQWYTVVGEVGDVHYDALATPANDIVYFPLVDIAPNDTTASVPAGLALVARTGHAEAVLSAVRGIVHSLDPAVPTYDEAAMRDLVSDASARTRALVVLLAIASVVTSLLAAVGLYGIIAYGVSVRRRELGIRLALGARPADVRRMVSVDGLRVAVIGVAIGMACALAATQALRGFLYGVGPIDLVTFCLTPVAVFLLASVASWIPARRAAAISPAEALRAQ